MKTDLEEPEFVRSLVRPDNERLYVTHVDIATGDGNGCGKLATGTKLVHRYRYTRNAPRSDDLWRSANS